MKPRSTASTSRMGGSFNLPIRYLPPAVIRDLPDRPHNAWRIIGPGLVASGVGLASGEFILWPYIASQVGLVFLWGALVGVVIQWFLNMEIERYTLATGETALTGFSRLWKHWGLVFALMVSFANLWPGWVTSSATMVTFIAGGRVTPIAVSMLLLVGLILTLAPVVYTALERLIFVKIAVIGGFTVLALVLVVSTETWSSLSQAVTGLGRLPPELPFALMMGAIAFAGAGGGQNLCQSNWIRDKGFGMGAHVPRLESALTGSKAASPSIEGYVFPLTEDNLRRWSRWWRFANLEQALTFLLVTVITIIFMSMLAHSTLFGRPDLPNDINFLRIEGDQLGLAVGGWLRTLFWVIGAYSLFAASVGIVDYTSRLAADVVKWTYLRHSPVRESTLYFWLVWGIVACGCVILLLGFDQPLVLLVISACVGGGMMFIYSILLLVLNHVTMPAPLKPTSYRIAALVLSAAFFGVLAFLTILQQVKNLIGNSAGV